MIVLVRLDLKRGFGEFFLRALFYVLFFTSSLLRALFYVLFFRLFFVPLIADIKVGIR